MNKFLTFIICAIFTIPLHSPSTAHANEDINWQYINHLGLLTDDNETYLDDDLWDDLSAEEQETLIDAVPNTISSASVYALVNRLLLSETDKQREDIPSPNLLSVRLNKLIALGNIQDAILLKDKAEKIFKEEYPDTPLNDYDLSLIELELNLTHGDPSTMCLDVHADYQTYRDMSVWQDLKEYCEISFGSAEKINLSKIKFDAAPYLKKHLINKNIDMDSLEAPLDTLLAFADNKITSSDYNKTARNLSKQSNLAIRLATNKSFAKEDTYQCYALEGLKRGIIGPKDASTYFELAQFSDNTLEAKSGKIDIHPCDIAAYFYQRIAKQDSDDMKSTLANALIQSGATLPYQSLLWAAPYLTDTSIKADIIRLGYINTYKDDNNDTIKQAVKTVLSPLSNKKPITTETKTAWDNDAPMSFSDMAFISQILSDNANTLKSPGINIFYENIFSLTYAKKSLNLDIGFNEYMRRLYKNDDIATMISALAGIITDNPVNAFATRDYATMLSTILLLGDDYDGTLFALEYIQ